MPKTVEQLIRESIGELGATQKVASGQLDKEEAKKISDGLDKIASLPYSEEAYNSVCEIMKLASSALSSTLSELDKEEEKIKKLEKIAGVRQIIDEMISVGAIEKDDVFDKAAELAEKSDKELEIVKEALKMSAGGSNIFFEKSAADASMKSEKRGMFDGVI